MLIIDGYKGERIVHVCRHPKFKRHLTILQAAFSAVEFAIESKMVKKVELGQLFHHYGDRQAGLEILQQSKYALRIIVDDDKICQWIVVHMRAGAEQDAFTAELKRVYEESVCENAI